ncbi:hypothetical protein ACTXM3_11880 [Glutamicibacter arilaitensis]
MSDSRGPLIVASDGPGARAVRYTPDESAKFALAIHEAAGYTEEDRDDSGLTHFAIAMLNLRMGIENQERITAEAKGQAELEAEALKLWLACRAVSNKYQTEDIKFSDLDAIEQAEWLAVARRAREIGAEK